MEVHIDKFASLRQRGTPEAHVPQHLMPKEALLRHIGDRALNLLVITTSIGQHHSEVRAQYIPPIKD